jgi:hypothetical protein
MRYSDPATLTGAELLGCSIVAELRVGSIHWSIFEALAEALEG